MRKLIVLGTVVLILVLALAAAATPVGQGVVGEAFPGERIIDVQGAQVTFGGDLQEPAITSSEDGITVEGAAAAFRGNLQEP